MPEAFSVTLLNGRHDNDGSKESRVCIGRVTIARFLAKQHMLFLLCYVSNCKILHAAQHCVNLHSAIIKIVAERINSFC